MYNRDFDEFSEFIAFMKKVYNGDLDYSFIDIYETFIHNQNYANLMKKYCILYDMELKYELDDQYENVGFQEYLFWDACTVNNNQEFRCLVNSSTVNGYEIGIVSAKKSNPYYMIRYSVSASSVVTLLYRPSTGSTNLGTNVSALSANTDTTIVMGIHDGKAYAKIGSTEYTSSAVLADQTDLIFYVRKWNSGSMTLKSLTWEVI